MAYGTGVAVPGWQPPKKPQGTDPYRASIVQGGQDYDDIMRRYRGILDNPNQNNLMRQYQNQSNRQQYTPKQLQYSPSSSQRYNPATLKYKRGDELTSAFNNLSEYSRTGGISDDEAGNIRARGVSPIRSIYANAQQNMNRNRALGGGYSPNYAASSAKMARELSQGVSDITTNVEAGLAGQRQQGRLAMAPQYAQFAANETAAMGDIDKQNESNRLSANKLNEDNRYRDEQSRRDIDRQNEENRRNAYGMNQNSQSQSRNELMKLYEMQKNQQMQALQGMNSMYGSTPGKAQLYGNQAAQSRQMNQTDRQMNDNNSRSLMDFYSRLRQRGGFGLG